MRSGRHVALKIFGGSAATPTFLPAISKIGSSVALVATVFGVRAFGAFFAEGPESFRRTIFWVGAMVLCRNDSGQGAAHPGHGTKNNKSARRGVDGEHF